MGYWEDVASVAEVHRDEIEGELNRARLQLQANGKERHTIERQIALLERLIELGDFTEVDRDDQAPGTQKARTLHEAMTLVIRDSPAGMLRAGDIAQEIEKRHLYRMRDGRPVEAQQIHARVSNYSHLFEKVGTFIKLVD